MVDSKQGACKQRRGLCVKMEGAAVEWLLLSVSGSSGHEVGMLTIRLDG